jgi:ribosomal protein L37AE/L43A
MILQNSSVYVCLECGHATSRSLSLPVPVCPSCRKSMQAVSKEATRYLGKKKHRAKRLVTLKKIAAKSGSGFVGLSMRLPTLKPHSRTK